MSDGMIGHETSLRVRLREKLPEILIEAASVVIALLLALALNSWNDARHDRERGAEYELRAASSRPASEAIATHDCAR